VSQVSIYSDQGSWGSISENSLAYWMVPQWVDSLLVARLLQGCSLNEASEDWWSTMDVFGLLPPMLCQAIVCRPSECHVDGGGGLDP
jgi:hypothetical protein